MPPCDRYTPETCPCNVHSAARAAQRAEQAVPGVPPAVMPLEDVGPPAWEAVEAVDKVLPGSTPANLGLFRLPVPGGWLYCWAGGELPPGGLTFVPHP